MAKPTDPVAEVKGEPQVEFLGWSWTRQSPMTHVAIGGAIFYTYMLASTISGYF